MHASSAFVNGYYLKKTSPKGFSASKCDVGNWIFSKSWEFFEKLFGNFMDFLGSLLRIFGEFFGNFLGFVWDFLGIFWVFFGNYLEIF